MRQPGHIKRAPRININHRATLVDADGASFDVTVTDISRDGFRIRTDRTLPIGARVTLRGTRRSEVQAQIRWSLGTEAGGVFLDPVTADV